MGAWGEAAFENDIAQDWFERLLEESDLFAVNDALDAVLHKADTSDADRCYETVAAAEVIAASRGRSCREVPEEIKEWLEEHDACADDQLAAKAVKAVKVVRDRSEAAELWENSPGWKRGLNGLLRRLQSEVKVSRKVTQGPELPTEIAEIVKQLRKHRADILFENGELWSIGLDPQKATDSDIDLILNLPNVPYLVINYSQIKAETLCRLRGCESLERLDLNSSSNVTDDVLEAISVLPKLRELTLQSTSITDAGLAHLHNLEDLQELVAEYSHVTGEGLVSLQQRFPNCDIRPIRLLRSAGGKIPKRTSKPFLWEGQWPPPK